MARGKARYDASEASKVIDFWPTTTLPFSGRFNPMAYLTASCMVWSTLTRLTCSVAALPWSKAEALASLSADGSSGFRSNGWPLMPAQRMRESMASRLWKPRKSLLQHDNLRFNRGNFSIDVCSSLSRQNVQWSAERGIEGREAQMLTYLWPAAVSCCSRAVPRSLFLSTMITRAPALANDVTMPSPRPEAPPVTRTFILRAPAPCGCN